MDINNLKNIFDDKLKNQFIDVEKQRKLYLLLIVIFIILGVLGSLIFIIYFSLEIFKIIFFINYHLKILLLLLPFLVLIFFIGAFALRKSYRKIFKNAYLKKLFKYYNKTIEYLAEKHIKKKYFIMSRLFDKYPDQFSGEDLIRGKIGKTRFVFSELFALKKHDIYFPKYTFTYYTTIFRGLFFISDFNKSFKGTVFVLPDKYEKKYGKMIANLIQKNKVKLGELIKLEDLDFEKEFVVYGSDQIEARYILSTSLMERILQYKNKINKTIFIAFVKNGIMIAVSNNKDLFEPKITDSLLESKTAMKYLNELKLGMDIIDILKLNVRIWKTEK